MRRLVLIAFLSGAGFLALDARPAAAWGWYGYAGGGCYRSYYRYPYTSYYRSYYVPRYAYGGYYRSRVGWYGWRGSAWRWHARRRW
jgi:hypothetical protein